LIAQEIRAQEPFISLKTRVSGRGWLGVMAVPQDWGHADDRVAFSQSAIEKNEIKSFMASFFMVLRQPDGVCESESMM
jgi:hypothetical protein